MRPTVQVLSEETRSRIVDEALDVLATFGMEIRGQKLRELGIDRGLEPVGDRIRFPREVVQAAVATAPRSVRLYDRAGNLHADVGDDRVHFVPGSSGLRVLDHRTGEPRLATTADYVEYTRLADQLQHLGYLATAFSTTDVPANISDAWRLYLSLTNSVKPVVSGAFTEHGVARMAEMMQLFRSDRVDLIERPMSIFTVTATGNFRYGEDSCQNLLDSVNAGIPVEIVPVTLMGLIAPVTLVGAAVFHTIDVLAGLTLAQLIRPGAPVLFGGAPAAFHMKAASSPMAAIEALRLDAAYVEIGKHLGLPTQSYMALSDAKTLDAQAGAETFGSALLAALSGVNSVSGPGMLDYVLAFSLPKLVFDDEMCGQALHFVRDSGPRSDLPVGHLIEALMQENHLIMADHTTTHWPDELYLTSPIIDRDSRETWLRKGGRTVAERAAEEVDRLLGLWTEVETEPEIDAEMVRLIRSGLDEPVDLPPSPEHRARSVQSTARGRRQNRRRQ
ncbi:MAG: trimethylamine methyltransferase family protein [Acidimicrobiia bacterium]|nr:trimethylamine methyltransferase family protein [Acidimicrobiia bacterium]